MNEVILMGRLTRDPETRYGNNGNAVTRYSLAVDRDFKREGEPDVDFLNVVAFGKNSEFAEKWLHKGMLIAVKGSIRTGSYTDKDGVKRNSFDIVVDRHFFTGDRSNNGAPTQAAPAPAPAQANPMPTAPASNVTTPSAGYEDIDSDEDLPF